MIGTAASAGIGADAARRLVPVDAGQLDVHQDQIGLLALGRRDPFEPVDRLDQLVAGALQQVADDLAVVLGVLDDEDALRHAAPINTGAGSRPLAPAASSMISSTRTGSTTRNVAPLPRAESTEIVPPCISTMRFEIARPSPVPPFLRVFELSTCWNSLEDPAVVLGGDAGAGVAHSQHEIAVLGRRPDRDLAFIGEFDRVADEVEQHLRQPARVAMPGRQARRDLGGECRAPCCAPCPRSR